MKSAGFVFYPWKVIGMGDLFLLLALDYGKLRQLEAPVLFEGEVDSLGQRQLHRSIALSARGSMWAKLQQRTDNDEDESG
jgi:hypothetical protein